jgi:hypothetical protein
MDALKIALETIIVGALALPWMVLLIDLFCPAASNFLRTTKTEPSDGLLSRLDGKTLSYIAGIFFFAITYLVGSAMTRVAEDFFNDDDLAIKVTEDGIRTSVYCRSSDDWLIERGGVLTDGETLCSGDAENRVAQTFAVQEGALFLAGLDKTDRLRCLRQQIVVLRGAAFDGVLVTLLCLFGTCAKYRPWGRVVAALLALGLSVWALVATIDHLVKHLSGKHDLLGEPPLMEGILLAIGVAGLSIAWKGAKRCYGCGFMFSALLTVLAFSGWWYTEIVYSRAVIYFFYAQTHLMPTTAH